jgi:hypothetical protein
MSANDQILIKKYKDKYYTFSVMAESWSKTNGLKLSEHIKSFKTFEEAYDWATKYTYSDGYSPEYDPSIRLAKDGANVKIINDLTLEK